MAMFKCRAVDPDGNPVEETMTAASARDLVATLEERGYQVSSVEPLEKPLGILRLKPRLTWEDLDLLNEQLLAITKSGLPLAPSIAALAQDAGNRRLRAVFEDIRRHLEAGHSLGDALDRHPGSFSPVYRALIKAGERTGNLSGVLSLLNDYSARAIELKNRLHEAIGYPAFVLIAASIVLGIMFIKVIPIYSDVFRDFGARLPWVTVFWITISRAVVNHSMATLTAIALTVILIKLAYRFISWSERGQYVLHRILAWFPAYGRLYSCISLARFCESLGLLLASRVPLPESLTLAAAASGNAVLRKAVTKAVRRIESGVPVADSLAETGFFPHSFCWMLRTGEQQGNLDRTLLNLAESNGRSAERLAGLLAVLLSPALILILALIIGSIIIALYLPIFSLADVVSGV